MTVPIEIRHRTAAGRLNYITEQLGKVHAQDSAGQATLIAAEQLLTGVAEELAAAETFRPGMVLGWNDCDPVAVCHCGARLAGDSVNDAVLAWTQHLTSIHKGQW
jgi:hypothetical protein